MPNWLKKRSFLLQNWQWIGLFILILLGTGLDMLLSFMLKIGVRHWRQHTAHPAFQHLEDDRLRPLGLMGMAVLWWIGLNLLELPNHLSLALILATKFLASFAGVWTAYRLVDLITVWLAHQAQQTDSRLDDALVPMLSRSLKIIVTLVGVLFIADNLNINITSLLAGLGLGGLAIALAAKDIVRNLFGSLTVLMDRTFTIGDWIIIGDQEGTVESIGFRSTKIRTFYHSLLTIPNSQFITATVDNMGERQYRRLSTRLSIAYETPAEQIESFCEGIRELIRIHPYTRKDYYHVYLNAYGESALEILLYVFWQTPDWTTELQERHRLLIDIKRLADKLNIQLAYPTRTVYLSRQPPEIEDDQIPAQLSRQQGIEWARQIAKRT